MVIAVNLTYFLEVYQPDYSKFMFECFSRIISQQPYHTFVFLSITPFDPPASTHNYIPIIITPTIITGNLSRVWYALKIRSFLKKYKADVFINADGFYSFFTKVPQCLILTSPCNLSDKNFIKKNHLFFYKKYIQFFITRARVIITESHFSKSHISQKYKNAHQKTDVVYAAAGDSLKAVEWEEKEEIKDRYAAGHEYFIFYGNFSREDLLLNLLKAFSQFKKWQKSRMQLLIVSEPGMSEHFSRILTSFKYKNDVQVLNSLSQQERAKIAAAAYAVIYSPLYENFPVAVMESMKCNVPVISHNTGAITELFADGVLYSNFDDPADIAQKLILIFKDENLRSNQVEKGRKAVQKYNWEETTRLLWHSILKAHG